MAERPPWDDGLPPGMKPDGTITVLEPGEPLPQPKIITPEGDELTPEEAAVIGEMEEEDDISDLDEPIPGSETGREAK